jgi:hypothetical protein
LPPLPDKDRGYFLQDCVKYAAVLHVLATRDDDDDYDYDDDDDGLGLSHYVLCPCFC